MTEEEQTQLMIDHLSGAYDWMNEIIAIYIDEVGDLPSMPEMREIYNVFLSMDRYRQEYIISLLLNTAIGFGLIAKAEEKKKAQNAQVLALGSIQTGKIFG